MLAEAFFGSYGIARLSRLALATSAMLPLAACEQTAGPPPAAEETAVAAPAPESRVLAADELAGEYRVAGVGGENVDLPYAITASITGDTIRVTADCVNIEWGYLLEDGDFSSLRVPTEGCARGLAEIEGALVEGLDRAERVTRTAANGFEFAGTGPTVSLFAQ